MGRGAEVRVTKLTGVRFARIDKGIKELEFGVKLSVSGKGKIE